VRGIERGIEKRAAFGAGDEFVTGKIRGELATFLAKHRHGPVADTVFVRHGLEDGHRVGTPPVVNARE
jgi:hypothetical protein